MMKLVGSWALRLAAMLATAAGLAMGGAPAMAHPVWREAYQSSPATFDPPNEKFLEFASKNWRVPAEVLRKDLTKQPVTGTVRYRIAVQGEGAQLRIRLSNEEGAKPLILAGASIGLAANGYDAIPGSLRSLSFGGAGAVSIPAGSPMLSDPVTLYVKPGTELVVTVRLAAPYDNEGRGGAGFMMMPGNDTMLAQWPAASTKLKGRPIVSGVSVLGEGAPGVIVAFGDSITDGNRAVQGVLRGWPEALARRLSQRAEGGRYTVVNAGISGNRVLSDGWGAAALARLDRDALRIDGITHLIVLEGINDINMSGASPFGDNPDVTAEQLIAGYRQIIARAHLRGVKVYMGTLTPHPGDALSATRAKTAIREAVNAWIRNSGEADGVIDFEAMVRDPKQPSQFKAEFDSGDHLHPSDSGHQAMADGIDLSLFP